MDKKSIVKCKQHSSYSNPSALTVDPTHHSIRVELRGVHVIHISSPHSAQQMKIGLSPFVIFTFFISASQILTSDTTNWGGVIKTSHDDSRVFALPSTQLSPRACVSSFSLIVQQRRRRKNVSLHLPLGCGRFGSSLLIRRMLYLIKEMHDEGDLPRYN